MNEELTKIIEEIRYREKINQTKIAERLGINLHYLSDMKNGRFPLTDEIREKLYAQFPYLRNDSETTAEQPSGSNAVLSKEITDVEYIGENRNDGMFFRDADGKLYISVPHVPYYARGEFPNLAESLEPLGEWGREVYNVDRKASGRYLSFDIKGDSMDNGEWKCLRDGDKVLVRELEHDNWRTLRTGDHRFWVLVFGSSVLIKEISDFDPTTGTVTCHSLNPSPEYADFTIPLDEVRHLYYVIRIKPQEISML